MKVLPDIVYTGMRVPVTEALAVSNVAMIVLLPTLRGTVASHDPTQTNRQQRKPQVTGELPELLPLFQ
jgi:hypothetical protein